MNEWEWQLLEEAVVVESVAVAGVDLKKGDLVRLRPRQGGDIFDLALAGQTAIIESIEQDYEGKIHFAVVLEDDPGKDLGVLRQPGHRFFSHPKKLSRSGLGRPPAIGLHHCRKYWWRASAIFFWAMTDSASKWSGGWLKVNFRKGSRFGISEFAVTIWRMRCWMATT